jgi:hypothetical protein
MDCRVASGDDKLLMTGRRRLAWILASVMMLPALLWPALWNGFPIVFYDTGGYFDSAMSGLLANGRSALYGAFLRLGIPSVFWGNIVVQAGVVAWLLVLSLRAHHLGGRPGLALAITLALAALTSLPWYVAQLMPDVWLPAAVLALYLLAFRARVLRRSEQIALGVVVAFALAGHMATLAVMAGLLVPLALWPAFARRWQWPSPVLSRPALAVAAGVLLILLSNLAITGRFALIPGGTNFLFGRLVHTGIAARYLAEHCPDPSLRLCAYRDTLPTEGDTWLWDAESPLWKMGGWDEFEPEARRILFASLRAYPAEHLRVAIRAALLQFVLVETGDYITPWTWHTHGMFEKHTPEIYPTFLAARQQKTGFDFTWINIVHVPVALASIAGLPLVVVLARRRRVRKSAAAFALTVFIALLGNAAICGALSNPHSRYQSRLVWLAPLALIIAAGSRRRSASLPDSSYFRRKPGVTPPSP